MAARIHSVDSSDQLNPNGLAPPGSAGVSNSGASADVDRLWMNITSLVTGPPNSANESATIMAAIKSHETSIGEKGMPCEWIWETWDQFTFRDNSEVWGESFVEYARVSTDPQRRMRVALPLLFARESSHQRLKHVRSLYPNIHPCWTSISSASIRFLCSPGLVARNRGFS